MASSPGYAVAARVEPRPPRFTGGPSGIPAAAGAATQIDGVAVADLRGEPLTTRFAERWLDFRQELAQTTFYLTDPNAWR